MSVKGKLTLYSDPSDPSETGYMYVTEPVLPTVGIGGGHISSMPENVQKAAAAGYSIVGITEEPEGHKHPLRGRAKALFLDTLGKVQSVLNTPQAATESRG